MCDICMRANSLLWGCLSSFHAQCKQAQGFIVAQACTHVLACMTARSPCAICHHWHIWGIQREGYCQGCWGHGPGTSKKAWHWQSVGSCMDPKFGCLSGAGARLGGLGILRSQYKMMCPSCMEARKALPRETVCMHAHLAVRMHACTVTIYV